MYITMFFTLLVGVASVLQGGLNRQFSEQWGLPGAIFINAIAFLAASLIYWFYARYTGVQLPVALADKAGSFENFKYWYVIPGILGFFFVLGVPWAIAKIGALKVFVGLVTAQLIGGLMWDMWVENIPLSWPRVLGAALALAGVVVASL